jgi:hypothetical protein
LVREKINSEDIRKIRRPAKEQASNYPARSQADLSPLSRLQQKIGNRAVQRLVSQNNKTFHQGGEMDEQTVARIERERSTGLPLESSLQARMQQTTGQDFSGVKIHTSPEAREISHQIGAKAFTTGQDIFFGENTYNPYSANGQELIAHELTHVVQQSTGAVGGSGSGGMTINPPGDAFEQEADKVARELTLPSINTGAQMSIKRQLEEGDEETVQRQVDAEDKEEQA